jgi:hypothetical protein
MGASWRQLREVCQRPVRAGNDVAGLLFGDHASLVITKLFVDFGVSPNYASIGFFVSGLAGAALQLSSGPWALLGACSLVLYYVLDCVDGEVARWQKVVNVEWGYYDYLFHMLIKPLAFFGVGLGLWIELDAAWPLCAAFCAATATLWRKILIEIPGILFLKDVLRRSRDGGAAPKTPATVQPHPPSTAAPAAANASAAEPFQLHFDLVTLRAALTNFDVGLVALSLATALDLALGPWNVPLLGETTARGVWLAYYGVVLPLDFLDYLVTYLRRRHFSTEMARLLGLAHNFSVEDLDRRER